MVRMNAIGYIVQVRLLVLPNLEPYLRLLEPEMQLEKKKNEMKRHEAWHVYRALMVNCALGEKAELSLTALTFLFHIQEFFLSGSKVIQLTR